MQKTNDILAAGQDLSAEQMRAAMQQVMSGEASHDEIVSFLTGLKNKGETVVEITAAAEVMRSLAEPVTVDKQHLVDTCGTGGDASGLFNVSTASAIVAATGGAKVAKHGNRSVSSKTGSADVLEAAGVNLDLAGSQVAECINRVGVGFMFAPKHHSAMKHAIGPRKAMGVRTIFNVLGPLTNPAAAPNQVLGVFDKALVKPLAEVLQALGSRHVMVVHSQDGLDEISIAANTDFAELKDGEIHTGVIKPVNFDLIGLELGGLKVESAGESLRLIQAALSGAAGPAAHIIALNAGAAIYVAGCAENYEAGVAMAYDILANNGALNTLQRLVDVSQELAA